jgi:eukaryotic-like serine/threonine-protein kinase
VKTELAGRRLQDRYVLEEPLDSGGMAEVWRARDEVLGGRPVAVKILHDNLARDPGFLERFRMEAVAAARLSHPAVVRVFDTGVDGEVCFIVMELFEGQNLAEILEDRGHLDPPEAASIAQSILDALHHAHAQGVVHRDVKPANVLIGPGGAVKVTDFGIAKAAFAGDITTTGKLLGTALYLAPEQVADKPADHRTDLYAAGVVLYEMLTGRPPFKAETDLATATMRLTQDPRPPGALRAGIPRAMEQVVMRALAREPEERFQSAEEMRMALDRMAGDRSVSPPMTAAPGPVDRAEDVPAPSFFRSWLLVPVIILAIAAVVVVAALLLGGLEIGGPLGIRPAPGGNGAPVKISSAVDHDPDGDGRENPELAALAIDGSAETAWETERYNSPQLGGLKPGVGLVLDLGRVREIGGVRIMTTLSDWRFEIRASDDGSSFSPVKDADGETSFVAEGDGTVELEPVALRYVLIWITDLAPADGGYRADIAKVQILPAG